MDECEPLVAGADALAHVAASRDALCCSGNVFGWLATQEALASEAVAAAPRLVQARARDASEAIVAAAWIANSPSDFRLPTSVTAPPPPPPPQTLAGRKMFITGEHDGVLRRVAEILGADVTIGSISFSVGRCRLTL